ncbi:ADP-ribose pyrophosphatase YjhB, NUDIX family [Actinopolyspora xinjiangensis]|uniref:ADP-ribose pyrophosphatase YjhB, NUDIX family n=1 Tax=Actinopolyspora xinjiangensis TaxID=405564 RepID=A0A1H0NQ22_9ACTN|nr:NUDIX hydrolase [Actinopolyspora xinjiangensis]SDO94794.1 ADP-ribose pyrophosphatase YjhB, NUDIX family [Actinopolyspora xinjiangensis]
MEQPNKSGEWLVHGERTIYESEWVRLGLADITVPSGERFEHHKVWLPPAAMILVLNEDESHVLLSYRHRFVSNVWNYELPGGLLNEDEPAAETAARELEEETGYRARSVEHLVTFEPMIGTVTNPHHVYLGRDIETVGDVSELDEGKFHWVPVSELRNLVSSGQIVNSGTLVAVLHYLAFSSGGY